MSLTHDDVVDTMMRLEIPETKEQRQAREAEWQQQDKEEEDER